jgi:hypothetical protein
MSSHELGDARLLRTTLHILEKVVTCFLCASYFCCANLAPTPSNSFKFQSKYFGIDLQEYLLTRDLVLEAPKSCLFKCLNHSCHHSKTGTIAAVGGPQEKMPFFQIAPGPFLSSKIHSNSSKYDPCKVWLKKMTTS